MRHTQGIRRTFAVPRSWAFSSGDMSSKKRTFSGRSTSCSAVPMSISLAPCGSFNWLRSVLLSKMPLYSSFWRSAGTPVKELNANITIHLTTLLTLSELGIPPGARLCAFQGFRNAFPSILQTHESHNRNRPSLHREHVDKNDLVSQISVWCFSSLTLAKRNDCLSALSTGVPRVNHRHIKDFYTNSKKPQYRQDVSSPWGMRCLLPKFPCRCAIVIHIGVFYYITISDAVWQYSSM